MTTPLRKIQTLLKHDMAILLGGSTFIFGIRLVGAAVTFVTQLMLVHWMGATELGKYVFAFSIASLAAFASTLGLPVAAMRFVPQALAKGQNALAAGFFIRTAEIVLVTSLLFAAVVLVGSLALSWNSPLDDRLTLFIGALLIPFVAALAAQNDLGRSIFLVTATFLPNMLLRHVFLFAGVVGLYMMGVQLTAAWVIGVLFVVVAGLAIGQFLYLTLKAREVIGPVKPQYETKRWVSVALPLVVVFGFTGFFLEINMALAGSFLPSADLAVYNLSFQIANLIAFFLVAVGYQFAPHASRLFGEGKMEALQALVSRTAKLRFVFAIGMFGVLALCGHFVLGIFGPEFSSGGYVALLILAATQVVAGLAGPVAVLQGIMGMERPAIVISALAVVVDLILTPILATKYGIDGAAIAVLVTMSLWNFLLAASIIRYSTIAPTVLGTAFLGKRRDEPVSAPVIEIAEPDVVFEKAG